jgi:hypothetical protein
MNRILTALVQLMLVGGALVCFRSMVADLKHDIAEMKNDLRKQK